MLPNQISQRLFSLTPHFTKGDAKAFNNDVMAGVSIQPESAEVFSHLTRGHRLARPKTLSILSWALRNGDNPPDYPSSCPSEGQHLNSKTSQDLLFFAFFLLSQHVKKLKQLLIPSIKKSCSLAFKNEAQITAKVVEPIYMFGEVNSHLSYLHKHYHYLSSIESGLTTSGPCFFLCKRWGSLAVHWEN